MADRMIRLPEVMRITSMSRAQIYRMAKDGKFPPQHRISHKVAVWSLDQVNRWVDDKLGLLV